MHKQLNKNKIIKSCILIVAMLFMLCLFSGCANISYYVIPSSDCYTEGVKISLTQKDAIEHGYNYNDLVSNVQSVLETSVNDYTNHFQTQLTKCYANGKITIDEYLFLQEANPLKMEASYELVQGGINFYIELQIYPAYRDNFYFPIQTIAYIFSYADVVKPEDAEQEDTSFIRKSIIATLYGNSDECALSNESTAPYIDYFLNDLNYASYGLTKNDASYTYEYATTSRRLHSNADKIENHDGYYVHVWNLAQDENGDIIEKPIELYYTYLNSSFWYLIGLGVTAIGGIIITLVLYFKHKSNIKKELIKQRDEIIIS